MGSKRFSIQILIRVAIIVLCSLTAVFLMLHKDLLFTTLLVTALLIAFSTELVYFVNRTNRELQRFLQAIRNHDYAVSFQQHGLGNSLGDLTEEFNLLIKALREGNSETEMQQDLLKLILEHINLGVLVLEPNDKIYFMNQKAQEILKVPAFTNWKRLAQKKPELARALGALDFEGRKALNIEINGQQKELFLDLEHIRLGSDHFKLLSFSDLKSEIEQKEVDAWHKLIRILAHEVMNSVTPVTSLSETIKEMLSDNEGNIKNPENITPDELTDIMEALKTIIRRSKGMLGFVEDYRKLTQLPAPRFEVLSTAEIFKDVTKLMRVQAQKNNVSLEILQENNRLALKADKALLEQALINLIGNAINHADSEKNSVIQLNAKMKNECIVVSVYDNGTGIEEDLISSIFIPFFSTRKNGTGIGLALTKNIMQLHQGSISVQSIPGKETTFKLSFPS